MFCHHLTYNPPPHSPHGEVGDGHLVADEEPGRAVLRHDPLQGSQVPG